MGPLRGFRFSKPMSHNDFSIEELDPRTLKPHPNNSRLHPSEQLAALVASFREFGFNGLVIVDEAGVILAGHGRTQAAVMAELATITCKRVLGWSDEKKRAFVIADNQTGLMSTWDEDMLLHEVQHLSGAGGIDLTAFGVDLGDLLPPPEPPVARDAMRNAEAATERPAPQGEGEGDPEKAFREEMADKSTKGQAPIVPMYAEHHQAFVIVCDNEVDEAWLRQRLGMSKPAQSYKDVKILTPNVITVAQLREALK